jgi:hypothetical protein
LQDFLLSIGDRDPQTPEKRALERKFVIFVPENPSAETKVLEAI